MKKIISLLVVFSMLFACFSLTSCDIAGLFDGEDEAAIDIEDVESNPASALQEASKNTSVSFFEPVGNSQSSIESALDKGSIRIYFASDDLMGDLTEIDETLYIDKANNKYVSDTSITYLDEEYFARIFLDKNGVALTGSDLFGTSDTYLINPSTLVENIIGSDLFYALEITDSEADKQELLDGLNAIKEAYDSVFAEQEANEAELNKYYELFDISVKEDELDGEPVIVVKTSLDNEAILEMIDVALSAAELDGLFADSDYSKDEITAELEMALQTVSINAESKLYIRVSDNTIAKQSIELNLQEIPSLDSKDETADSYDDEYATESMPVSIDIEADVTYSSNAISAELSVSSYGVEAASAKFDLTKKSSGSSLEYNMSVSVSMQAVTLELLNAKLALDKGTGDFTVSGRIATGEETYTLGLTGNFQSSDTKAVLSIDSLTFNNETVTFDARIEFEALSEIPALPDDAKDVVFLTEDELNTLIESIENSRLGQLIGAME